MGFKRLCPEEAHDVTPQCTATCHHLCPRCRIGVLDDEGVCIRCTRPKRSYGARDPAELDAIHGHPWGPLCPDKCRTPDK